jgi:hypothetical protein
MKGISVDCKYYFALSSLILISRKDLYVLTLGLIIISHGRLPLPGLMQKYHNRQWICDYHERLKLRQNHETMVNFSCLFFPCGLHRPSCYNKQSLWQASQKDKLKFAIQQWRKSSHC